MGMGHPGTRMGTGRGHPGQDKPGQRDRDPGAEPTRMGTGVGRGIAGQQDKDRQGEAEARRCGRRSVEGHTDRKRQDSGTGLTGTGTGRHRDGNTRVGADGQKLTQTHRERKRQRRETAGQTDGAWPGGQRDGDSRTGPGAAQATWTAEEHPEAIIKQPPSKLTPTPESRGVNGTSKALWWRQAAAARALSHGGLGRGTRRARPGPSAGPGVMGGKAGGETEPHVTGKREEAQETREE